MQLRTHQWMSHELRTLLSLLAAPLERLERRCGDDPPSLELLAAARGYLEVIGRLGDAMADAEATPQDAQAAALDTMVPSEVASRVGEQLRPMALEFGLSFALVATAASRAPVAANVGQFTRIVSTLIELSIRRTMAPGHVAVSIDSTKPGELLVSVESSQSMHELPLPFTTRLEQLGGILARVGGRLDSFDLALGGAMLEVTYPVGPAVAAAEPPAPAAPVPEALPPVVAVAEHTDLRAPVAVVVDDEPHILEVWVRSLRRSFRVYAASDGQEGLRLIRRVRPDIILTDNVMPVMCGPELVTEVRTDPSIADTPILCITACVTPELRSAMRLEGPGETLVKPVRPVDLIAKATALAEAYRARRSARVAEHTDPVTGLLTGGRLRAELERCLRGTGAALVVTDIQRFQQVNDLYGRLVGDQVLAMVADAVRQAVRAVDKVARLGDDEFAVLLEDVEEDEAAAVAERIARAIAHVRAEDVAGVDRIVTTRLRAHTAVTVACEDDDPEQLLQRALAALQRSKQQSVHAAA